jgi:hypothetical protein
MTHIKHRVILSSKKRRGRACSFVLKSRSSSRFLLHFKNKRRRLCNNVIKFHNLFLLQIPDDDLPYKALRHTLSCLVRPLEIK